MSIPVHRMDESFSGIYIAPFGAGKPSRAAYESSAAHRHDFYYAVLLEDGWLEMEIDFRPVRLEGPAFYLSYPGQVHRVNGADLRQGWYLAFEPSVLDEPLRDILDQSLSAIITLQLAAAQSAGFALSLGQLDEAPVAFRFSVQKHLVNAFIYQVSAAYLSLEQAELVRHPARSIEITRAFRQLLRRQVKTWPKASDFADRLHITSGYLNDTVKSVTGFTATQFIHQEQMREAQRLLSERQRSVREVAAELGFEDEKYFSRLFRKITGCSPSAFRKNLDHFG